jgi:alginate O-acetyltransferase complex protein AlgJ
VRVAHEQTSLPAVHEAWLPREHALHRPRHGGKQLTALVCALLFFVTPAMLWVFGGRPAEIENHRLAGFPSITEGWGFFTGLPEWATDQLIFRKAAINAADGVSRGLFGEPAPFDQGGEADGGPLPGSPAPAPNTGAPDEPGAKQHDAGYRRVVQGTDGWLYYGFDVDAKCSPATPFTETVAKLRELRAAVESSGRQFVFVIAPDKTTMVPQHLPASYPGEDCSREAAPDFWRLLTGLGGALDLRPALYTAAQQLGRPVYPAKDTHWRDEGSLVLTRTIAEAVRPGVTQTWQSAPIDAYTSLADLPTLLGRQEEKQSTRYDLRPDGHTNRAAPYVADTDEPAYRISAPMPETVNKRTLIFGDSFTNASSRYLAGGFSHLTMLAYPAMGERPETAVQAFADAEVVVVQVVERGVAAGNLPFLEDGFIERVRQTLAARPIR